MPESPTYICIDLKSFYASVECVERGLDPLNTNLVVADPGRTEKTICLAVTPSLKAQGLSGRPRYFEVLRKVREINLLRKNRAPGQLLGKESCNARELAANPSLTLAFLTAIPRMALYIEYSTRVYSVYLKYISQDDIHVYSIDEVFIDATHYLKLYKKSAHDLADTIIRDILVTTGVTATVGIGPNLYLAKIAMDIMAKHVAPDKNGVRIAELDVQTYRQNLWTHVPLTDFWRVGKGYAQKLAHYGIKTMGDIARYSLRCEDFLFRLFGINAELLIDHAWGYEPCTMADIKSYKPAAKSLGSGQILHEAYTVPKARLVVIEMVDALALDLVSKRLATDQIVLTVGFDRENLAPEKGYTGPTVKDSYGRTIPKHAHGTANLPMHTSSGNLMTEAVLGLFDRIVSSEMLVRRINLAAHHILPETALPPKKYVQLDLFSNSDKEKDARQNTSRERKQQEVMLKIRQRYGKNSLLKGMNFEDGATARERNQQIGGHRA